MKNKILILLCLVLSAMLVFASCEEASDILGGGNDTSDGENNNEGGNANEGGNSGDNGNTEAPGEGGNTDGGDTNGTECQHTFSDAWSTDTKSHWHQATCEHGEIKDALGDHTDADESGFCDVCEYEVGHTHTYADEWSSDLENHWKEATCSHKDRVGELGLHYDDNSDAACDACGAHVHVLTTSGMCLGCGEQVKVIDTSNISSLIQTVTDHYSNVNGGKIVSSFVGRGAGSTKTNKVIEYVFGDGSAYFKEASAAEVVSTDREGVEYEANTSDVMEKWRNREEDGSVYGVYRETVEGVVGEFCEDASANEDTLYGYYFAVSTLANGYGAEGILAALYERSQEDSASDFVYDHEEGTNTYRFSFNSTIVNSMATNIGLVTNVNYFVVSVEFTYDDNYVLTNLKITCDCYTNDAGANLDGTSDSANVDLIYDAATGKATLKEGALADTYTFTVEQTAGERTFVNEYTKAYFAPKGFLVYFDNEHTDGCSEEECKIACPDTVTVAVGEYARFYLQDSDGQKFTTATSDGLEWATSDESGLSCHFAIGSAFSFATSHVKFLAKAAGTYTVTLSYQGLTRTITVVVTA